VIAAIKDFAENVGLMFLVLGTLSLPGVIVGFVLGRFFS
jgi:hypothetical protein